MVEELWTRAEGDVARTSTYWSREGSSSRRRRAKSGDLPGAIGLLVIAGAGRALRHPAERHLRQWYVLADLLESSGDVTGARQMFERVVRADPELADAEAEVWRLSGANSEATKRPGRLWHH